MENFNTTHLKLVPPDSDTRVQVRDGCRCAIGSFDSSHPPQKTRLEAVAREILVQFGLPEGYLGWTMVVLLSAFWQEQLAAVPTRERLLLLPPAGPHGPGCDGRLTQSGAQVSTCPCCAVEHFRLTGEKLGYQVLLNDGSSEMMSRILGGSINSVVGVATLDVLERAIDKILLLGVPCGAIPFVTVDGIVQDCDWIEEMIQTPYRAGEVQTRTYLHLMREAGRMFEPSQLRRLAPRLRTRPADSNRLDPLSATEELAYQFLAKGGKHSRPFITLAVYDALTGGLGTAAGGSTHLNGMSDAIRRAALSIETFHKASLVHDDIEDDDEFRYGDQTLHRKYGTPTAINVGDYLIGLGYRLVSRETKTLGAEVTAEILDCLADAHMRLSEGQGAELIWRDSSHKALSSDEALHIYALKTAPAFEAALWTGLRLAGPLDGYVEPIRQFARYLGVAFQILNDLHDWTEDSHNKLTAGGDIVGGRPTVLWALALEQLPELERQRLIQLAMQDPITPAIVAEIKDLYQKANVFTKAAALIEEHQCEAESLARQVEPRELRELFFYLIEMVLDRQTIPLTATDRLSPDASSGGV